MGDWLWALFGDITPCPQPHTVPPAPHLHLKNMSSTARWKLASAIFVLQRSPLQGAINIHIFLAITVFLPISDIKTWRSFHIRMTSGDAALLSYRIPQPLQRVLLRCCSHGSITELGTLFPGPAATQIPDGILKEMFV